MSSLRYAVRLVEPSRHVVEVTLRFAVEAPCVDVTLPGETLSFELSGLGLVVRAPAMTLPAELAEQVARDNSVRREAYAVLRADGSLAVLPEGSPGAPTRPSDVLFLDKIDTAAPYLKVDAVAFHWYGVSNPNNPSSAASSL